MARGKKAAQGLTLEEKLAQALVPMEEQPYQIPENWCWVRLLNVANLYNGDRGKNYPSKKDYQITGIPFINAGALVDGQLEPKEFNYISEEKYNALSAGKIQCGDILYCLRGSLGKSAIVEIEGNGAISSSLCILRCTKAIDNRFLFFLLNSDIIKKQQDSAENGSAQPNLSAASVIKYMVPLPSILEQQRIVDRIESIFAKLDEAKEKAQAVVDGFELRKSAILHKAFTGELTAKWREEHKIEIADWKNYKIDECCKVGSGGTPSRKHPEYYEGSIPWIKTGEIDWNDILDAEEKISDAAVQDSSAKIYEPGVVLVAMYGMGVTRGKAAILRVQAATNQAVCVLQPKNDLLNRYLFYYFMYNYWNIREKSVGGNQLNLSATIIKNFDILIPSIDEQIEIIRILDGLLAKEKAAKEAAESILDQIDTMKKAVLARAFRCELGTNDPTEESAVELLKSGL